MRYWFVGILLVALSFNSGRAQRAKTLELKPPTSKCSPPRIERIWQGEPQQEAERKVIRNFDALDKYFQEGCK